MRDGNAGGIGCASMMAAVALTPCASDDDGWRARGGNLVSDTVGTKNNI